MSPGELVALLSASGAMSETIPPSLVLMTIGSVNGVSIAALFTGGLVPALVLALALAAVARWRARDEVPTSTRASWTTIVRLFAIALPGLALPFIIPRRRHRRRRDRDRGLDHRRGPCVGDRCRPLSSLPAACIVQAADRHGQSVGRDPADHRHRDRDGLGSHQSGFSNALAQAMASLPGGKAGFIAISIVAFVILGSVLEGIPAIVVFGPLLFPIARIVGVNAVHYAMVVVLAMGVGLFAPPSGVGYYAACAIGRVEPAAGMKPIVGYLIALLIGLVIVAAVPWLSIGFL